MGTQTSSVDQMRWDEGRWASILDRMEHRQPGIGLRFWGPPLWLEVTMEGPDSEAWSVAAAGDLPDRPWDWQSTAPCAEVMGLEAAGADDGCLLEAAGRYTVENLILNAAHEIGEWLRFDARRLFGAHDMADGEQGNGVVRVGVEFKAPSAPLPLSPRAVTVTERAERLAAPWRFTYLPGTSIAYGPHGPVVTVPGGTGPGWETPWSTATVGVMDAPPATFVAAVQRDVHWALVSYEAQRVCDAFYIDAVRPWPRVTLTVSYDRESGGTCPGIDLPSVPVRSE
jgi:hypothetical protein